MTRFLVWLGIGLVAVVTVGGLAYAWAASTADAHLAETFAIHEVDFPVPMPIDGAFVDAGTTPEARALEQAIERGRHLASSRYPCGECHGRDLGGGVMVDDPAMGRLLGPNLTLGKGSVTREYTVADWDRIVRHGVRRDGRPALMPSEDFLAMSDQELSDLIAWIRSLPPVDAEVPPSTLGPVGKILVATGRFPLSVRLIADHDAPHLAEPPAAEASVEFGGHLAKVCTGCHRQNLQGGPIVQGPPGWAPASDLTPTGLAAYDFVAFQRVMREGIRPDGQRVREPMTIATAYAANMTETELEALWLYFQSLPPSPPEI